MNIIELAREAGMPIDDERFIFQATRERVTRFAALVRAAALAEQPTKQPLTDEELYKVFPAISGYTEANKTLYRSIARAIEAAHGIGETK
jgi:hypothetical protein